MQGKLYILNFGEGRLTKDPFLPLGVVFVQVKSSGDSGSASARSHRVKLRGIVSKSVPPDEGQKLFLIRVRDYLSVKMFANILLVMKNQFFSVNITN